jgi:uncharacterized protein YneF (UPF0154 family)
MITLDVWQLITMSIAALFIGMLLGFWIAYQVQAE